MNKVRCHDPKFLKAGNKQEGHNCKHLDHDRKVCMVKKMGGGKHPTVFPTKPRKCPLYEEA